MNLGKILSSLIERKSESYNLQYGVQFDSFFTNLKKIPDISTIKMNSILILTDQTHYSLISIAYMVRLADALGKDSKVFALTESKHTQAIKDICKEYTIDLQDIHEIQNVSIDDVQKIVNQNKIGLIIVSYAHKLRQLIQDRISVTVLVTTQKNF